ncbi:MAG: hypothetical protein CVV53_07030 [Spirochaetae bacterium HGW-Spirochaetae-9]|nr:MAG: hypothetical protein CVV53_07030 [Spirochaetae bacterium HGW-Spirochaetae-9]
MLSLDSSATVVEEKLSPGEWALEVKAFTTAGKEVAMGSTLCLLQPGRTTSAKILLYPIEGTGTLSLAIDKNLEVPTGGRITGNLSFKGLPGKALPQAPAIITVDIPAEQSSLEFEDLGAGHYGIFLQLLGSDGIVSGGCVETILIVAGFQTSGACKITMGMPIVDLSAALYPASALPAPIISVEHTFSDDAVPLPIAVSRSAPEEGEAMLRRWYVNGEDAGMAVELVGNRGLLPEGTFVLPRLTGPSSLSTMRVDFVEESLQSFRAGSASATLDAGRSARVSGFSWRASYNYAAAMGRSLGETTGAFTNGTGTASSIKAIAASPSGMIAVSGLDYEDALHAFAATYGAELDPAASPGAEPLSIDASWIRLWRNKMKVNNDYKNADRLAISDDGHYLAAAASSATSSWIWLARLDEGGLYLDSSATIAGSGNLANMISIKGLCFSPGGDKLFAVANKKDTIFAFSVGELGLNYAAHIELDGLNDALSLEDIKVTRSGSIVVSAEMTSKLYVIQDDTSFSTPTAIAGNSESGPYHPTSIAISEEGDAFYVLCDGDEILCFSRTDPSSPYSQVSSFSLPYEAEGASCMAVGTSPVGGCETLAVAGGDSLVFFDMGSDRIPDNEVVISAACCNVAEIADAKALSYLSGAFIVGSSGTNGKVSVFGRD